MHLVYANILLHDYKHCEYVCLLTDFSSRQKAKQNTKTNSNSNANINTVINRRYIRSRL